MTVEKSEEIVPDVRLFSEMYCKPSSAWAFEREFVAETTTKDGRFKLYLPQHYDDIHNLKPEKLEGTPRSLDGVRHTSASSMLVLLVGIV
jgi:hypothetical protein